MKYFYVTLLSVVGIVGVPFSKTYEPDTYEPCDYSKDCSKSSTAGCTTIYQHRNYGGWKQCVSLGSEECVNLSDWWTAEGPRLSSLDTHNTCVRIFDAKDCTGFSSQTAPNSSTTHQDFSSIGWEDVVRSISSCDYPSAPKCVVKHLFGPQILSAPISDRAEAIAQSVLTAVGSSVGGFFPGVNIAFNVLQLVQSLQSGGDPYPALIDAKVDAALAQNAAVQLKAKMGLVEKWMRTMILGNDTESQGDKRIELLITLHTCEEIFLLLKDSNYAFSANKVLSSPYMLAFSNVYYGLASILYKHRSDLRTIVTQDMSNLAQLNQEYLKEAKAQRKAQFTAENVGSCGTYSSAHGLPCGPIIQDKLLAKNYEMSEFMEENKKTGPSGDLEEHKRCVGAIQESIENKLDAFFTPTINRLLNFVKTVGSN